MGNRALYLRVGLLLIIGAGLLFGFVLFLSGGRFAKGQVFESYFRESVQGLVVGAAVKFRGVPVGDVTELALASAEYNDGPPDDSEATAYHQVVVRYRIDVSKLGRHPDIEAAVAAGLRARLATQGLTGLAYVELDFARNAAPPPALPWKPRYPIIPSVPSTLSQVSDAAQHLAARLDNLDIEGLVNSFSALGEDLRAQLRAADIPATVAASRDLLATLRETVQKADLPGLAADLRQTADSARALLQSPQLRRTLANAETATAQLAAASRELAPLLSEARGTVRRANDTTADLTADLATILRDAEAAVANLRDATETLRRDPGQVLFGAPPPRRR